MPFDAKMIVIINNIYFTFSAGNCCWKINDIFFPYFFDNKIELLIQIFVAVFWIFKSIVEYFSGCRSISNGSLQKKTLIFLSSHQFFISDIFLSKLLRYAWFHVSLPLSLLNIEFDQPLILERRDQKSLERSNIWNIFEIDLGSGFILPPSCRAGT